MRSKLLMKAKEQIINKYYKDMTDKKIIILALILAILLVGGGWYYSKKSPGGSLISPTSSFNPRTITQDGILIGDSNAKVTIEEYTNFVCPACGRFAAGAFVNIMDDYIKTSKVKMIIYVFPPYELGRAALCSQEQNKFMEFHDYIFAHQTQITKESDIRDLTINAGLDIKKYDACYNSDKYADIVNKWNSEGTARGVDATPTFFINGQKLIGAQPYGDFKKIIDEKLSQINQ
ncbi:hypothetical protein COU00_02695 [Candidatus Falkowbacteria bacterium CG10_big_fil_rev_8_21_14_0_10_43_11]|uniref:Thioredoxin-like fold domain-containing protein n=1 Tax=Candidatus Falkowbacteria bacterium CG10_big_fil_rev_8_21_14_0_10_43_11 TaxID=1974568 RepID=A0A2M6WLU0_9BACT|nr:MAG: hypothetical protein COU00_02695 [Candidatus Falkowbacteria bacterium CG10_big_fil_rev_8_21_14_0_10_43_11]